MFKAVVLLTVFICFFYYFLRSFIKENVVVLSVILLLFLICSFLEANLQRFATIFLLGVVGVGGYSLRKKQSIDLIRQDLHSLKNSGSWTNMIVCLVLFMSFITWGIYLSDGFYAPDLHHPVYELSLGNSYAISIFNPPDLSYSGKILRYHFLS